jgi:hypothetical protein
MAFLPLIPQSTDQLSVSQGNILNNFTILGAIAGNTNPSSSSLNATSGFNWLYLPPNGAIPPSGSAFPAGNVALYSSLNATTTANEIYINKADATQVPMTAFQSNTSTDGWTALPSGILMKWGQATSSVGNLDTTYNGFGPNYSGTPYACIVTTVYDNAGTGAQDFDRTVYFQGFNIGPANTFRVHKQNSGATVIFNYLIIGLGSY